jgi:GNAT superfamily N-acetyltransferase
MEIGLVETPRPKDIQAIRDGLRVFNEQHTVPDGYRPLNVLLRDDQGNLCGGLLGETFWDWLDANVVCVAEPHRGSALGSRLLRTAEEAALERGCKGVFLDTLDFQAPEFYTKHGYTIWGEIGGLPPGHRRILYKKRLDEEE